PPPRSASARGRSAPSRCRRGAGLREVDASAIVDAIKKLCMEANYELEPDMLRAFDRALATERSAAGRQVLQTLKDNAWMAQTKRMPYCQDTGVVVCFVELGQEDHLHGVGLEGVKGWILECVKTAGPDACPPLIVGVGVGGTFEKAAVLSMKALFRELGSPNPDPAIGAIEREVLERANRLGIGPQGYGGD